jgi:seryl-tRNA synthetase
MGRPPIGKTAMSATERVRRYRAKHQANKRGKGKASDELRAAQAEIVRLRSEIDALNQSKPDATREKQRISETSIDEASAETLREKLRDAEKQLANYKTRIKNLNGKVAVLTRMYDAMHKAKPILMSKRLHRDIRAFLHPDRANDAATAKKLTRIFQEFSDIKFAFFEDPNSD